jgi:penicillin-binding protein 2
MMVDRKLEAKQKFFRWLTIALFGVIVIRLITLQLWESSVYSAKASQNQFRFLPIRAPRGDIVDSKGVLMASNKIVNTISINPQQIDPAELDRGIDNLAALLHDTYPEIDAAFIEKLIADHDDRSFQPVVVKRDVSMDLVERLEERRRDLPGVQIGKEIVRSYPGGPAASHLLGYIGEISSKELEQRKDDDYKAGDLIGKFGLEVQYESYLRGLDGFQRVEVDVHGRQVQNANLVIIPPQQGDRLVLTVDSELQQVMEESMDTTLARLQSEGLAGKAGAAVAIDVKTGAVLAMTSRPNFDPNSLVPPVDNATVRKYLNPPAGTPPPMINRAIGSRYAPGSTFKPITAMAALISGNVKLSDTVNCTGRYWISPNPGCWDVHGTTNFFKAMAVSCDVYFYEAGRKAGAALMARVAQEFGLDQPTGIDLPGEVTGNVPSPDKQRVERDRYWCKWYEEQQAELDKKYEALLEEAATDQQRDTVAAQRKAAQSTLDEKFRINYNFETTWQPFATFFMAIGQYENDYTPIGLANYIAQLANNGQRMRPYLVQRIEDRSGEAVAQFGPEMVHNADIDSQVLATVKQAMAGATDPGGTASGLFYNYPVKVAAKTGTAETGGSQNNGLFVAFAPADNPTIAFAGIVEDAVHGSDSAGMVAKAVLDQYFGLNKPAESQLGIGDIRADESPAPDQQQPAQPTTQPQQPSTQPQQPTTQPQQPPATQPEEPSTQPEETEPDQQQPPSQPDETALPPPQQEPQTEPGGGNGG